MLYQTTGAGLPITIKFKFNLGDRMQSLFMSLANLFPKSIARVADRHENQSQPWSAWEWTEQVEQLDITICLGLVAKLNWVFEEALGAWKYAVWITHDSEEIDRRIK